jgi:excinuclease ABC subunit C
MRLVDKLDSHQATVGWSREVGEMGQAGTGAPPAAVAALPQAPGVYRFRDARAGVLYLGRAVNLRRRVASYWGDLGSRGHLAPMVARIARVQALVCDSEHEAAWLERNLLERRLPRWNRTVGGQEVPVYIRLDLRPRSAGLKVVHAATPAPGARYFGPYLGGFRVRLAASALHRVLPVSYAADGLRGSDRGMAAARGIGPGDRSALTESVVAVLERDAAAQKVTLASGDDADVHGWAVTGKGEVGGVLVSLAVRNGRLGEWRQRSCGEAAAAALLAATPPVWAPFARRNAELAAQLAGPARRRN